MSEDLGSTVVYDWCFDNLRSRDTNDDARSGFQSTTTVPLMTYSIEGSDKNFNSRKLRISSRIIKASQSTGLLK